MSSFAAHAPARTRLLLSAEMGAILANTKVRALELFVPDCHLDLERDVQRIDVALAEPAEIRLDLSGALSVDTARCVLGALQERGLLHGTALEVVPLARGVRIATKAAVADGPSRSSALASRFDELARRSKSALVADLAPGGAYEVWSDGASALSLRAALRTVDDATAASTWAKAAFAAESSGELRAIGVTAEGPVLKFELKSPTEHLALLLRQHVVEAFRIPSSSMLPALQPGDHFFAVKGPRAAAPERGDIVVFSSPRDPSQDFVKRVIGVAGDHIELDGYRVRVNGEPLPTSVAAARYTPPVREAASGELWKEALGTHEYQVLRDPSHPSADALDVMVEPETVFLLGDNRDNSFDSRHFGSVPLRMVKGRVLMIWASFGDPGVNWERFGTVPR
jgi:signal peptidase I